MTLSHDTPNTCHTVFISSRPWKMNELVLMTMMGLMVLHSELSIVLGDHHNGRRTGGTSLAGAFTLQLPGPGAPGLKGAAPMAVVAPRGGALLTRNTAMYNEARN